ncbi:serine/threonine protein kinase [Yinghuangia sp. KLBMP8922]|uniref:non-specific serine/threonine protein kinase n=2 Tax=Yinghuangia soli TaxID=2908204 RepID=A0AA41U7B8_9ACTN|nr:serine/threonine protein kinase [Yinghuangia soli]
MGEVWRAEDRVLERQVAVKILLPALLEDERFAKRFRREAKVLAALDHPGIVDVHDYGEGESEPPIAYIVMELVDGLPLDRLQATAGPLSPARVLGIAAQALDALHAAHRRGIVHRDIKPSNLMIGRGDRVTVTDFGIALTATDTKITASNSVLGTARYMAPEQAQGHGAVPASDLYAMGALCYELLVGTPLFSGESVFDVVLRHIREPAPDLPATFPEPVRELIAKSLKKTPDERHTDAAAMAAAVRSAALALPDEDAAAAVAAAAVTEPIAVSEAASEANSAALPASDPAAAEMTLEPTSASIAESIPGSIPEPISGSGATPVLAVGSDAPPKPSPEPLSQRASESVSESASASVPEPASEPAPGAISEPTPAREALPAVVPVPAAPAAAAASSVPAAGAAAAVPAPAVAAGPASESASASEAPAPPAARWKRHGLAAVLLVLGVIAGVVASVLYLGPGSGSASGKDGGAADAGQQKNAGATQGAADPSPVGGSDAGSAQGPSNAPNGDPSASAAGSSPPASGAPAATAAANGAPGSTGSNAVAAGGGTGSKSGTSTGTGNTTGGAPNPATGGGSGGGTPPTLPPAGPPPAVTPPQGCGGSGWGHITNVGSNARLGLSGEPVEGTQVVLGGRTEFGWFRKTAQWDQFFPCSLSKPALSMVMGASDPLKLELGSAYPHLPNWRLVATTGGAFHIRDYMGQDCLTSNGVGKPLSMEACTPGLKTQEWWIPASS